MKKINLKNLSGALSSQEMKNVKGGGDPNSLQNFNDDPTGGGCVHVWCVVNSDGWKISMGTHATCDFDLCLPDDGVRCTPC